MNHRSAAKEGGAIFHEEVPSGILDILEDI